MKFATISLNARFWVVAALSKVNERVAVILRFKIGNSL
jgi:hypothetical protein